jgi:LysM repeat protein
LARREWRRPLARYAAPIAFLAAVTVAVLLVRSGLDGGDGTSRSRTSRTTATVVDTSPGPSGPTYYRIRAGDTLGGVAGRFDTTVGELLALNPKVTPNSLTIGQRLRVR